MAISLTPAETQETPKITLSPGFRAILNDKTALDRARRYDYGMGEDSLGVDRIASDILLGHENRLRQFAAASSDVASRRDRAREVTDIIQRASDEGRGLDETETQKILELGQDQEPSNPQTILEHLYARRYSQELMAGVSSDLDELAQTHPEQVLEYQDRVSTFVSKRNIAARILEEEAASYQGANIVTKGWDFVRSIIPWHDQIAIQSSFDDPNSPFFLGTSIQHQVERAFQMSVTEEEFESRLRGIIERTRSISGSAALFLAQAFVQYSDADAVLDNIFTGLDVFDVATIGIGAAVGAAAAATRVSNRTRSALKSPSPDEASRLVTVGKVDEAAEVLAKERLDAVTPEAEAGAATRANEVTAPDVFESGFSLNTAENAVRAPGSLAGERANRLLENLTSIRRLLASTMTDAVTLERIPEEAFRAGVAYTERIFRRVYNRLDDAIIDIRPVRGSEEAFGGVDRIDVLVGKTDATPFGSAEEAQTFGERIYRLAQGSFDVVEESGNFFLRMSKTIDESALELVPMRTSTANETPSSFVNTWLGALRTPDDVLTEIHRQQRKTATYGANMVLARLAEASKAIGRLTNTQLQRHREILDMGRRQFREVIDTDGEVKKIRGRFYNTVDEFEQVYLNRFKELPSEKETEAYFTFREIMDFDHTVRNAALYRDQARLGIEDKQITFRTASESGRGMTARSGWFKGRDVSELPSYSSDPYSLMWIDDATGKVNFTLSDRLSASQKDDIQRLIDDGYQVIQVSEDDALRKLTKVKTEDIEYVVVKNQERRPLSLNQLPYNEGGHWNYNPNAVYIKQAKTQKTGFGRRVYHGDTTAHAFDVPKLGREFVKHYEHARQLLKDVQAGLVKEGVLDAYLRKNTPYTARQWAKMFSKDGPFDIDTPFVLTQSGQSAASVKPLDQVFNERVVNPRDSGHNLRARVTSEYTQERGELLTTIDVDGTEANPIFNLRPASMVDPLDSLSQDVSRLARNMFYDDYVHGQVERWAAQFADALDVPIDRLRADPVRYLTEAPFKKDFADASVIAAAKNERRAILNLLGQNTPDQAAATWVKQKIVDGIFEARGMRGVRIVEPWLFDKKTDIPTMMRSIVFHAKLGLYNIVQLPLQAAGSLHVAAVDGSVSRASKAPFMYWALRARKLAEATGKEAEVTKKVAKALGVEESVLDEMYTVWRRTGLDILEGEHANLDDYLNPKMFQRMAGLQGTASKSVGKVLDTGKFFFNEGNQLHRGMAYATAFLRWREENPTRALKNADIRSIVERADLYYLNMSRASNSTWQQGLASIPTQFFAYHARLSEQMLSTRLTPAEKLRVFGMYSAMWGVPVGVGATAGVAWPVHDTFRQAALDNGYDPDTSNIFSKFLMEGAASVVTEMLTGENFNIGDRYGPGGLSWLKDLIDSTQGGDTTLFDVLGASPNFFTSAVGLADPFVRQAVSIFAPESEQFPLTQQDFIDALREISSVNNTTRAYQVFTTGEWLTKRDALTAEVDIGSFTTAVGVMLGLTPSEIADTYLRMDSNRAVANAKAEISNDALLNFRRGLTAYRDGNRELGYTFFKRAHAIMQSGGFTASERASAWSRAVRDNGSLMEQVNREWMLNDPENRNEWYARETLERLQ